LKSDGVNNCTLHSGKKVLNYLLDSPPIPYRGYSIYISVFLSIIIRDSKGVSVKHIFPERGQIQASGIG